MPVMKKLFNAHMFWAQDIQVQIAIANMPVPAHFEVGETIGYVVIDIR